MKIISNIFKEYPESIKNEIEIRNNQHESLIRYPNGSSIRIIPASSSTRGFRFNGAIIDFQIDSTSVDMIILPAITSIEQENGSYEENDRPFQRVFYCNINESDVIKSDQMSHQLIYESSAYYKYKLLDSLLYSYQKENQEKFLREYMCMWENNTYDHPVVEKELNGNKVLLYEAWGIPKGLIEYSTEFVNKTKQTYLNINGEYKIEEIGFENDINVHLEIDTNIYDGYEVHIEDGLITVTLHEIKNEIPILKDYGVI